MNISEKRFKDNIDVFYTICFIVCVLILIAGGLATLKIETFSYYSDVVIVDKTDKQVVVKHVVSNKIDTLDKDSYVYKDSYLIGQKMNIKSYHKYPYIYDVLQKMAIGVLFLIALLSGCVIL